MFYDINLHVIVAGNCNFFFGRFFFSTFVTVKLTVLTSPQKLIAYRGTQTYCMIYGKKLSVVIVNYCLCENRWFKMLRIEMYF